MRTSRAVARTLLSSMFVVGGLDAVRNPETKVKKADSVARPIAAKVPGLPDDTETLVKINGAVQVGAGVALALGKWRRLAALALIGSAIPTTAAGHRFWEETDDTARAQQRTHFLKNLGLIGGLILALVDTQGAPSLGWKARRSAKSARRAAKVAKRGAKAAAGAKAASGAKALADAGSTAGGRVAAATHAA